MAKKIVSMWFLYYTTESYDIYIILAGRDTLVYVFHTYSWFATSCTIFLGLNLLSFNYRVIGE